MKPVVGTLAIVGCGLIGSSIARAARRGNAAARIVVCDADASARRAIAKLGFADAIAASPAKAVVGADMVVLCTPMSTYAAIGRAIGPKLKTGAILSDAGSVKRAALDQLAPFVRKGVHLVPAHPVAGTENSGPEAGFAELFDGRWCIVTPIRS
jgi:cyclohexadieny/prephenate dehydrogenase